MGIGIKGTRTGIQPLNHGMFLDITEVPGTYPHSF